MACINHPLADAGLSDCWVCGQTFCPECLAELQGHMMCAPCKAEAVSRLEQGVTAGVTGTEKAPWERRDELGLVSAYVQTTKEVMTGPSSFFERLDKTVTTYACLGMPMITQTLVMATTVGFYALLAGMGASGAPESSGPEVMMFTGVFGILMVVFAPLLALVSVFIGSGLTHLFLSMTKKAGAPYHQTMRGYCYASAPGVVGVVPVVGPYVGGIWSIVAQIIMVMKVHRVSGGMATLAVLGFPLILGCCAGILLFGVIFASVAASR